MEKIDILPEDEGVESFVKKRLFNDTIDTLDLHVDRKRAVGDELRYSVLYLLYKCEELPRKELVKVTGKDSNALQHHLRELLNNNLIAEVPTPTEEDGRKSYYRITKLGAQEIEADIQNITGSKPKKLKYMRALSTQKIPLREDETPDRRTQGHPKGVDVDNADLQSDQSELKDTPDGNRVA